MRRLIWLLVLGLLSLAAFPALAGAPWSVWLYHPESRQLVQVNNFGEAQTFALALPLDAEMDGLPAFFRSGDWIAYCTRGSQDRLSVQIEALEGAPTYGLALPTAYDLDHAAACRLGPAAFNVFGDPLLAVGVLDGETGMSDSWRLLVFDLMAGTVAYDLAPDDEAYLAAAGEPVQAVALPVVLRFEQDLVLRLEPVSAEESGEPVAFRWNPETGDVIRAPEFDRAYDILQSGEMVWVDVLDASTEAAPPGGDAILYDDGSGQPYPIFRALGGNMMVDHPVFIDHGQQVAVQVRSRTEPQAVYWTALRRDGTVADLPVPGDASPLVGAQQGYTFLHVDAVAGMTTLYYHRFDPNDGSLTEMVLWQTASTGWAHIWQTPMPYLSGMATFTPLTLP